eukprot:772396-Pelagomonas_calceolata.AAC.3
MCSAVLRVAERREAATRKAEDETEFLMSQLTHLVRSAVLQEAEEREAAARKAEDEDEDEAAAAATLAGILRASMGLDRHPEGIHGAGQCTEWPPWQAPSGHLWAWRSEMRLILDAKRAFICHLCVTRLYVRGGHPGRHPEAIRGAGQEWPLKCASEGVDGTGEVLHEEACVSTMCVCGLANLADTLRGSTWLDSDKPRPNEIERSEMVNEEMVYFIFQMDLDVQLQRALNYEAYEFAQGVRAKRQRECHLEGVRTKRQGVSAAVKIKGDNFLAYFNVCFMRGRASCGCGVPKEQVA